MIFFILNRKTNTYRPLSRRLDRCDRVIQNESRDPFGGNVYYVTMQITFPTRKFRNGERNFHCDVVHITTNWVSSLTPDCNGVFAIKAYRTMSRQHKSRCLHLLLKLYVIQCYAPVITLISSARLGCIIIHVSTISRSQMHYLHKVCQHSLGYTYYIICLIAYNV